MPAYPLRALDQIGDRVSSIAWLDEDIANALDTHTHTTALRCPDLQGC